MGNRNILKEPDVCSAPGQEFTLTASQTSWEQHLLEIPSVKLHHQEAKNPKKNGYFAIYKEYILFPAIKMTEDGSVTVLNAWNLSVHHKKQFGYFGKHALSASSASLRTSMCIHQACTYILLWGRSWCFCWGSARVCCWLPWINAMTEGRCAWVWSQILDLKVTPDFALAEDCVCDHWISTLMTLKEKDQKANQLAQPIA